LGLADSAAADAKRMQNNAAVEADLSSTQHQLAAGGPTMFVTSASDDCDHSGGAAALGNIGEPATRRKSLKARIARGGLLTLAVMFNWSM